MAWRDWEDYVPPQRSRAPARTSTAKSPMIPSATGEKANDSSRARQASSTRPRSKYGAVKTTVDNIVFDSKKEAARYQELKALEKAGEISGLELQPRLVLQVMHWHDGPKKVGEYRGDFRYTTNHGAVVIEDVKGIKTPVYRLKKRMVEGIYGIRILEV